MPSDRNSQSSRTVACGECKRLKLKCDMKFPCARCVRRGLAAICPEGELAQGQRGQRVLAGTEALHDRIAQLEEALRLASSSTSSANAIQAEKTLNQANVSQESGGEDNLSAYSHLIVEESGSTRYFGAASSEYLAKRSTQRSVAQHVPTHGPLDISLSLLPGFHAPTSISILDIIAQILPHRETALQLGENYFQTFGWTTNIVPQITWTIKLLDPAYSDDRLAKPQCLALLLIILALGARLDVSLASEDSSARTFAEASQRCLAHDSTYSVSLVQYLYLYHVYVMNGRNNTALGEISWPILRFAMTVSEAIGLHRDPTMWDMDESEALERRIVFWETHHYDVIQSVWLGRGQCIPDYAIDCAFPDDKDDTIYHRKAYELSRIWSRINDRQIRICPSTYKETCEIHDELNQYESSLPAALSQAPSPSMIELADRNRNRLAFRRNMTLIYLTEARIVLHRNWFVKALKEYPGEPMLSPHSQSYICCLDACRSLVGLTRNMIAILDQSIQARWHFFFHLFSACVCLASCAIRAPSSSLARIVIAELNHGIDLFRQMQRHETPQLERLRDFGLESIRSGMTVDSTVESEDLDLLSARKTLRRETQSMSLNPELAPYTHDTGTSFEVALGQLDGNAAEFDVDEFLHEIGLS